MSRALFMQELESVRQDLIQQDLIQQDLIQEGKTTIALLTEAMRLGD
jgi:hypothetical protein